MTVGLGAGGGPADDAADGLLLGSRGRRLCLAVASGGAGWTWPRHRGADPSAELHDAAVRVTAAPVPSDVLWSALVDAVDSARYWQEPDGTDDWLADPHVAALLRPVAEAIVADPAVTWWWSDAELATQTAVGWPGADGVLPAHPPTVDPEAARRWTRSTVREEARAARERPADPTAPWSGSWWSAPSLSELPHTTRTRPGSIGVGAALGQLFPPPTGLDLVEDEMGWPVARTWPIDVHVDARVLEVRDATGWADLVSRHPLPATAARRHDWFRATGRTGEWLVPDWGSVAEEVDAVHVCAAAWLAVAGRAVEVPGTSAATVLAGWDPDATWWLTDVVESGDPTDWVRTEDDPPNRWRPA